MSLTIALPIEISNEYGTHKSVINVPILKTKKTTPAGLLTDIGEDVLAMVSEIRIVDNVIPLVVIKINKDKEKELTAKWGLSCLYKSDRPGFSIDISKRLNESTWKMQLLGKLAATVRRPIIFNNIEDDYPIF